LAPTFAEFHQRAVLGSMPTIPALLRCALAGSSITIAIFRTISDCAAYRRDHKIEGGPQPQPFDDASRLKFAYTPLIRYVFLPGRKMMQYKAPRTTSRPANHTGAYRFAKTVSGGRDYASKPRTKINKTVYEVWVLVALFVLVSLQIIF
jgi:hypothetical protein